jgi:hypothetical protein
VAASRLCARKRVEPDNGAGAPTGQGPWERRAHDVYVQSYHTAWLALTGESAAGSAALSEVDRAGDTLATAIHDAADRLGQAVRPSVPEPATPPSLHDGGAKAHRPGGRARNGFTLSAATARHYVAGRHRLGTGTIDTPRARIARKGTLLT